MKKILIVFLLLLTAASCATSPVKMPQVKAERMDSEARTKADAYYHFMVATLHEQEGDFDAAMEEYQAAYRLDPGSAEIAMSLSTLYLRKGQTEQATVLAKKAAELAPDKTGALLLLANIYTSRKKYDEAADLYRKVVELNPKKEAYIISGRSMLR
jgi:Tfp pilus assembly protein PilF